LDTQLTTNSVPLMYSCTSRDSLMRLLALRAPRKVSKAARTSASLEHKLNPSEPTELRGLTTSGYVRLARVNSSAWSTLRASVCLMPLSPSALICSCMWNLFVRASDLAYTFPYGRLSYSHRSS